MRAPGTTVQLYLQLGFLECTNDHKWPIVALAAAGSSAWLASCPMTAATTGGIPPGSDRLELDLPAIRDMTGQAVTETGPREPGLLYDARRGIYYAKPALRGWLHVVCFWASVAGGGLLLARAHGEAETAATVIYSASLSALFGTSALYHRGAWTSAMRLRLRHLDQAMIFFLIAGTATPVYLLSAPASTGLVCLIVMWALTIAAVAIRLARSSAPELVAGALFVGLGCAGGLSLPWVWIHAGSASGVLVMLGGLLYIVGALSYHRRWPDPYPSVFGYHEVFHFYVCAAAACQYAAIARLIS